MRFILSRKGFDTSYGGAPSPIVDGRPVSLPIPGSHGEPTSYGDLGLGDLVAKATRSRLSSADRCHDDPMFADGHYWLGQVHAAQGHLRKQGVTAGDVFLFFGLFADPQSGERHHRIFGAMTIAALGAPDVVRRDPNWREPPRPHPHFSGQWPATNTIYFGPGLAARRSPDRLRLTGPGSPLNRWIVPQWLSDLGLSYHGDPARWLGNGQLDAVRRGQEFVCDIGEAQEPRRWLESIFAEIAT